MTQNNKKIPKIRQLICVYWCHKIYVWISWPIIMRLTWIGIAQPVRQWFYDYQVDWQTKTIMATKYSREWIESVGHEMEFCLPFLYSFANWNRTRCQQWAPISGASITVNCDCKVEDSSKLISQSRDMSHVINTQAIEHVGFYCVCVTSFWIHQR